VYFVLPPRLTLILTSPHPLNRTVSIEVRIAIAADAILANRFAHRPKWTPNRVATTAPATHQTTPLHRRNPPSPSFYLKKRKHRTQSGAVWLIHV